MKIVLDNLDLMPANNLDPLFKTLLAPFAPTKYLHGSKFDSCQFCDTKINEEHSGKEVRYTSEGQRFCACVCDECYPDFQELLNEKQNVKITNYN